MNQIAPDTRIPASNPELLERLITTEYEARARMLARGVLPEAVAVRQCESNYNTLLAHWPDGKMRYVSSLAIERTPDETPTLELPVVVQ